MTARRRCLRSSSSDDADVEAPASDTESSDSDDGVLAPSAGMWCLYFVALAFLWDLFWSPHDGQFRAGRVVLPVVHDGELAERLLEARQVYLHFYRNRATMEAHDEGLAQEARDAVRRFQWLAVAPLPPGDQSRVCVGCRAQDCSGGGGELAILRDRWHEDAMTMPACRECAWLMCMAHAAYHHEESVVQRLREWLMYMDTRYICPDGRPTLELLDPLATQFALTHGHLAETAQMHWRRAEELLGDAAA